MRREEHDRHSRKVARIQWARERLLPSKRVVIRKNRSRVYFSMIERAPDVKGARYQPANSPWTRLLKEWTIGEDYHCYLKLLRSPWGAFDLSSTTFMR